jgi:hypothetical protein
VSPPSPSALCGHPCYHDTILSTAAPSQRCGSMGRQDATTPTVVRPPAFRQPDPRNDACTTTREEAPTPPPSKPLLNGYRARHDVLLEARFARTAVYSTTLYTIPPHVIRTVLHDCKPPLAYIKSGRSPGRGGTTMDSAHLHAFRLHHDIGTKPQSNLRDLEVLPPLPPCL